MMDESKRENNNGLEIEEQKQQEKVKISFVPEKFSDFTLNYLNFSFKLHKAILCRTCTYFIELFDGDPSITEITIPEQFCHLRHLRIDTREVMTFLGSIYDEIELNYDLFFRVPNEKQKDSQNSSSDVPVNKMINAEVFDSFALLAHYFGCSKIETQLVKLVFDRLKSNNLNYVWEFLKLAEVCHWKQKEKIIAFVGINFIRCCSVSYRNYDKHLNDLKQSTRNQITAIENMLNGKW